MWARALSENLVRWVVVLVDEGHELPAVRDEVLAREVVGDVPPDRAELPAVLRHRVEEAEAEEQAVEDLGKHGEWVCDQQNLQIADT